MTQPALFAPPRPPSLLERGIDLRNADTMEVMRSLPSRSFDLVIADPPWDYVQTVGATRADNHYGCLLMPDIIAHLSEAARLAPLMLVWATFPKLGEFLSHPTPWGMPVTGGAWGKSRPDNSGHFGQGYWFSGCSEIVLLFKSDSAHCDRGEPVRNLWYEEPGRHSRKPVEWQRQWLRKFVPAGGAVYDVYAGLGSVAEATLLAGEGRRYVGAELDAKRHADALSLCAQARVPR